MQIMHTNRIHEITVSFRGCTKNPACTQLLDYDLFPGTDDKPKSAFSFAALKQFHTFNLGSKTAAHNFHKALK